MTRPFHFFSVGQIAPQPDWGVLRHEHSYHQLIVIQHGQMTVTAEDGFTQAASAGDVLLYPAHCWHEEHADPDDPVQHYFINFSGPTGERAVCRVGDRRQRFRTLARWLWQEQRRGRDGSAVLLDRYLDLLLLEFQQARQEPLSQDLLDRVQEYIGQNLDRPLTVDELAREAAMSKFHFIRRFKALTGRTPMQEVRRLRLESARDLVLSTNLPLKAIATQTGWANEYHLCRHFRRQFGQTTSKLRVGQRSDFRQENTPG